MTGQWGPLFGLVVLLAGVFAGWVPFEGVLLAIWLENLVVLALAVRAFWSLPPEGRVSIPRGTFPKVLWTGDPAGPWPDGRERVRLTDLPRASALFQLIKPVMIMAGVMGAFVLMFIGGLDGLLEMGLWTLVLIAAVEAFRLAGRIDADNAPAVVILRMGLGPVVLLASLAPGLLLGLREAGLVVAAVVAVSLLMLTDVFVERRLLRRRQVDV